MLWSLDFHLCNESHQKASRHDGGGEGGGRKESTTEKNLKGHLIQLIIFYKMTTNGDRYLNLSSDNLSKQVILI